VIALAQGFLPEMFAGFLVNVQVALSAVLLGLVGGLPLALLRWHVPRSSVLIRPVIRLMQAAPVYVIMFFLLNLLPSHIPWFGKRLLVTGMAALILSQAINMVAYMAENGYQALEHLHRREWAQTVLFLPNVMRGFIVVVMSSGLGAAVGVHEVVGVTLRHAQRLPDLADRVALFLMVMAFFVTVFSTANALLRVAVRRLTARRLSAPASSAAASR